MFCGVVSKFEQVISGASLRARAPNNGLHPTRNSVALMLNLSGGRVMPGVMPLPAGGVDNHRRAHI